MTVYTAGKNIFELLDEKRQAVARLVYTGTDFNRAVLEAEGEYVLDGIATGTWVVCVSGDSRGRVQSRIKVQTGGVISIKLAGKRGPYLFKKPTGWKLRFSLVNREGDDLLTIIPSVNWQKESHDYVLQLNEELENECDLLLILQAVHCANCSLSMMTGGTVPALVSI